MPIALDTAQYVPNEAYADFETVIPTGTPGNSDRGHNKTVMTQDVAHSWKRNGHKGKLLILPTFLTI